MTSAVVDTNKPVPIALNKFPDGLIWSSVFTGGKKPFCESTTYDADTLPGCNLFPCFRAALPTFRRTVEASAFAVSFVFTASAAVVAMSAVTVKNLAPADSCFLHLSTPL